MTSTHTHSNKDIQAISNSILNARRTCSGLAEYPGDLPDSLCTAYRLQDLSMTRWPDTLVGWKVGGIDLQWQAKFASTRLCGPIYAKGLRYASSKDVVEMAIFDQGFAAVEAELIVELGDVSTLDVSALDEATIKAVIRNIYLGVEIASSPIRGVNDLGPVGPISDFGNNSGLIVGPALSEWQHRKLEDIVVTTEVHGTVFGPASPAPGMEGPLGAVHFLLQHLQQRNIAIPPGTLVSSGAITGVHEVKVGSRAEVQFAGLTNIPLTLSAMLP